MRAVDQWGDMSDSERYKAIHTKADTDVRPQSIHHTLGYGPNQAMSGGVLEGLTLPLAASGTYSQSDMQAVITALRKMQGL